MMRTYIFICSLYLLFTWQPSYGQDTAGPDSVAGRMNLDAIYDRPALDLGKTPVAIGGYAELNTNYENNDGVSEGWSFHMRRMSLFLSSTVGKRIRFLTELEFEDGTKEINLETAILDIELHPLLNLRGGVLLNPIGSFNQNHDGPNWEFVDRPVMATEVLPATWSNAGAGIFGKYYFRDYAIAYECYLTNGFDERIISNDFNRTRLASTKENEDRFEETANGTTLLNGKLAFSKRGRGEIGLSYMGGIYNRFELDGLSVDRKRRVDVLAADLRITFPRPGTELTAEAAWIMVDIPSGYTQQFGERQFGFFVDVVQTVSRKPMFGFEDAELRVAVRLDYADWNTGTFSETGGRIGDEVLALVPAVSWRPVPQTVLRFNYRYVWQKDLLDNPAARSAVFQAGLASYF